MEELEPRTRLSRSTGLAMNHVPFPLDRAATGTGVGRLDPVSEGPFHDV